MHVYVLVVSSTRPNQKKTNIAQKFEKKSQTNENIKNRNNNNNKS